MALSNSQYESIMRVYNRTQLQKKHELDARVDEVYEKIPAVREMNDAIAAAAVKSAKELLAGDADAVKRLRGTIADLKEQRQVLMSAYGYPADYLEMQYNCPDCKDTGYKDGIKCHCFRQREIDLLYAQSNIREVLERENFSHFSYFFLSIAFFSLICLLKASVKESCLLPLTMVISPLYESIKQSFHEPK